MAGPQFRDRRGRTDISTPRPAKANLAASTLGEQLLSPRGGTPLSARGNKWHESRESAWGSLKGFRFKRGGIYSGSFRVS